jgi:hypothetical protein
MLKNITHISDSLPMDQLEANLSSFFQWGFLGVGGFYNVNIPTSGCYGGDLHKLRLVNHPYYTTGTVWEGFRKDWVWETGVSYSQQPIRVSGVYVNNSFVPVGSALSVDYPNGRINFTSPVSPSSTVTCSYSYRLYQIYTADNEWWQEFQTGSFRADDSHLLQQGSGSWDILAQNRVQLPAVVVEAVPRTDRFGRQLGGGQIVRQDVVFHIFAEDRWHFKWLHDAISAQQEKRIGGFDKNKLFSLDRFPLDANGQPRASGLMYPDMINTAGSTYWEQIRLEQPKLGGIHYCTIRGTFEFDEP